MKPSRYRLVSSVIAAVVLLVSGVAGADSERRSDPDDSSGSLDIARVSHFHRAGRLVHRVRMRDQWSSAMLTGKSRYIAMWISTNDTQNSPEGFERLIWIHFRDGKLAAGIYRFRADESGFYGRYELMRRLPVRRANSSTVDVRFGQGRLGRNVDRYRWFAESNWRTRSGPCRNTDGDTAGDPAPFEPGGCQDRGPNRGELQHQV